MCDDIFDDSDSEQKIIDNNWKKDIGLVRKEGYRNGLSAAEDDCVQQGFNEAFAVSGPLLYKAALLRGTVSALLSSDFLKTRTLLDSDKTTLTKLLGDITSLEMQLLNFSEKRLEVLKHGTVQQDGSRDSSTGTLQTGHSCNKGKCSCKSDKSNTTGNCSVEGNNDFDIDKTSEVLDTGEVQGDNEEVSHGSVDYSGTELPVSVVTGTRSDQEPSETSTMLTPGTSHDEPAYSIQDRLNMLREEYQTLMKLVS